VALGFYKCSGRLGRGVLFVRFFFKWRRISRISRASVPPDFALPAFRTGREPPDYPRFKGHGHKPISVLQHLPQYPFPQAKLQQNGSILSLGVADITLGESTCS
jgi:hypothetical protein